jgi:succinate-acetate transporter protein
MATVSEPIGTVQESPPAPSAAVIIGNPAPLGLYAFAVTTFLLSMVNGNLVSPTAAPMVYGVALMVGGVVQLLAGMWCYRAGNMFSATLHSLYGGFWLSFWALVHFYAKGIPAIHLGNAIGLYLIGWALMTVLFWVATFKTNLAVNGTLFLLTVTFLLLGIGNSGTHLTIIHWGGYVGLATAAGAAYVGLAEVLAEMYGRPILPVRPL